MNVLPKSVLKDRLRIFLQVYNKTNIIGSEDGTLRMHVLHAKTRNTKIMEKLINYKLLRLSERLLNDQEEIQPRDSVICEFLIDELEKYVANSLKK